MYVKTSWMYLPLFEEALGPLSVMTLTFIAGMGEVLTRVTFGLNFTHGTMEN